MQFLIYFIITIVVLFLSYRITTFKAYIVTGLISLFILIKYGYLPSYDSWVYIFYINLLPFIVSIFKKGVIKHKEDLRNKLEDVKSSYEDLMRKNKYQLEANIEREKRLQKVLAFYEISKDMSSCIMFEDIFNIFSSALRKFFRFSFCRLILLKPDNDISAIYQIELGQRISKVMPDDLDKAILGITYENKNIITISKEETVPFLRRLSVIKDFGTLVVIPLFVEETIMGVLYIENIPKLHFGNFIILAGQFAIQFQRVFLYKKVEEMSITDSLTGISTRRYFIEHFEEELRRSMKHKANLSLLILDLDYFKEKNDRFGHLVGDVLLKEVAVILKSNLREIDIIGRYGGEEFSIVLSGIGREGAFYVGERIRRNIETAVFKAYDENLSTTVSIGISVFPDDGVNVDTLIESADKSLYKAKQGGRNKVC